MDLTFLAVGWALYFFMHSMLASLGVKSWARKIMGNQFRHYRILYVILSTIGLFFLLFYNSNIPSKDLIPREGLVRYLSLVFAALGVIVLRVAFRSYKLSSFLGLEKEDNAHLVTSGILQSVRHPIYTGTVLIVIGYWLFSPNVPTTISSICILVYLPIGMWLEEKKLIGIFGDQYIEYKRKVPALVPRLW